MKRPSITTALAAATVFGSVVMVHAQAQDAAPPPPHRPQDAAEMAGPHREPPAFPPGGPHAGKMRDVAMFDLAGKLAAAEIYIGVKPQQLDAWRAYTQALLDLVSTDEVPPPPHENNPAPPSAPGSKPEKKDELPGEMLSELILKKSDKAKTLQDAATALRSALTPSQVGKLVELDRNLMRRPPPIHGPGPESGPYGGPQDDDHQPEG